MEDFWFGLCVPNLMPIFSVLMDWKTVVIYFLLYFSKWWTIHQFHCTKNICLLPSWTWTPMLCYEIYYLQKILAFFVRWLLVVSVVSPVYIVSSHSVIAILLSPFLLPYLVFMQCIIILQKSREEWCTKQFEFVILTYLPTSVLIEKLEQIKVDCFSHRLHRVLVLVV